MWQGFSYDNQLQRCGSWFAENPLNATRVLYKVIKSHDNTPIKCKDTWSRTIPYFSKKGRFHSRNISWSKGYILNQMYSIMIFKKCEQAYISLSIVQEWVRLLLEQGALFTKVTSDHNEANGPTLPYLFVFVVGHIAPDSLPHVCLKNDSNVNLL